MFKSNLCWNFAVIDSSAERYRIRAIKHHPSVSAASTWTVVGEIREVTWRICARINWNPSISCAVAVHLRLYRPSDGWSPNFSTETHPRCGQVTHLLGPRRISRAALCGMSRRRVARGRGRPGDTKNWWHAAHKSITLHIMAILICGPLIAATGFSGQRQKRGSYANYCGFMEAFVYVYVLRIYTIVYAVTSILCPKLSLSEHNNGWVPPW